MNTPHARRSLAVAALAASLLGTPTSWAEQSPVSAAAPSQPALGTIVGIIIDSARAPVAHATVTATRADGGGIHSTISGADGTYSFADLAPGEWAITYQAGGHSDVAVALEVVGSRATRHDIVMPLVASTSGKTPATRLPPATAAVAGIDNHNPADQVRLASAGDSGSGGFGKSLLHVMSSLFTPDQQDPPAGGSTPSAAPTAVTVPEALQAPDPAPENDTHTPLANVGDIGWMNGNTREAAPIFDTKFFTPEIRFDVNYIQSTNQPRDHTIVGSTEEFRSGEFQIEQVSFGGNFHWHGVQARFLSMMGQFATATSRNDASAGIGQWDLQGAYKYFSEANAGYHWDNIGHGLSVDAGIFVSYIGLFSYYNFDNWTYQPSYVSSNTPWFFNGLRIQYWPTQNLKIEPWIINGWQSNAKYNGKPGFGGQILWIPSNNVKWVFNTYTLGQDNQRTITPGAGNGSVNPYCPGVSANPNCSPGSTALPFNGTAINWAKVQRFHEDDSFLYKFYDHPKNDGISKIGASVTWDFGCEYGGGVNCLKGPNKANFFGIMEYNRFWFGQNHYAVTVGGGMMTNPGRYLTLLPPINGATAATGSPYFTEDPGQKIWQWDTQINFQYMPQDWITWWTELTFRSSNVPYWSGSGGVTPPNGNTGTYSNNGSPTAPVCMNGSSVGGDNCANEGGYWYPDLRKQEWVWGLGVMVKF
jgi:hypothetical protein